MKSTVPIVTLTAIAGFAGGWLLKPDPEVQAASLAADTSAQTKPGSKSHHRREQPLVLKKRIGGEGTPALPEAVAARVNFHRAVRKVTDRLETAKAGRFTEALGLSEDQEEAVAALLAGRRDGFREQIGNGKNGAEMVEEAGNAERLFQQEIRKVLDPEQIEAFEAMGQREKEGAIEASAYTSLADLSTQIDLSPEQRDQVLASLREGSKDAQERRPEGWALMRESFSVLANSPPSVIDNMGDMLSEPEIMKDPQAMHQYQLEARRRDMESKTRLLSGILTPAQLAQYRSTLNARLTLIEQAPPPAFQPR